MKKKALMIIALALIAGCLKKETQYQFNLKTVTSIMGCTAVDESYTEYSISGEKLVLTTYAVTPDLCYKLNEIKPLGTENNFTFNVTIKENLVGICGTCKGSLVLVYEVDKPPYNKTNILINIIIEKELTEQHNFVITK